MKHLVHQLGLLIVAVSLMLMPLPVSAATPDMPCCDDMHPMAMAGMHHADMATKSHPSCTDSKNTGEQPHCCQQMAHASAAVLLDETAAPAPAVLVPLFALAVVLPESAPSGLRTPPPNA